MNDAYSQHWRKSKATKDLIKQNLAELIKNAVFGSVTKFRLDLRYNTRLDVDNTVTMVKLFVDQLRYLDVIADDRRTIFTGFSVTYDKDLPQQTYQFTVIPQ
ncbi:hypothetical protein [Rufibacter ruber]|uniref:hypothetical protein n=1 Tax=Rufibacter ruber TaxID=1783499 RepID=UPI000834D623|nr:hypothetical protein [Rufibacter ruber]